MTTPSLVRQIESLFEGGSVAGLSDRQLLERFAARRDAGRRGRLRRAGGPARADGAGRLPAAPGRPRTMPRTPSRPSSSSWPARPARSATPTCWATGSTASRVRTARKARLRLARRRRTRGGRLREAIRPCRSPPVRRPIEPVARPRAGRGPARRDRPPAAGLPPAGRALLLRGPHPRRGGAAAPMARRHGPQPAGPGAREAPPRPDPPRRRPARRRAGRGPGAPVRLGVRLIPSCATSTTRAAIALRGRTRPPAGRSRPRRRPWPRRCCDPC